MRNLVLAAAVIVSARFGICQNATPRIYVEPQSGFESYLSAAIVKKHVPAVVTQDKENATFVLTSVVLAKEESTGSKIARCMFAYCVGIQGTQTATVQLISTRTQEVAWAYNVLKASANAYQSTAEAAAKHLKKYLEEHPMENEATPPPIAAASTPLLDPPPPPAPPAEATPAPLAQSTPVITTAAVLRAAPPAPDNPSPSSLAAATAPPSVSAEPSEGIPATRIVVRFTSDPATAEVSIDGEYWGSTPTSEVLMRPGPHVVTVKKRGYQRWERKLTLTPGDTRTVNAELELEVKDPTKPKITGLDSNRGDAL